MSGAGSGESQRRTRMSRTSMTDIKTSMIVVTVLRKRGGRRSTRAMRRLFGMVPASSSYGRSGAKRPPRPRCLRLVQGGAGRHDHSPGTLERALLEFERQQPLALERTGQLQLAGLRGRETEAGIIGRISEQKHRAMATRFCRRKRVIHQRGPDAQLAEGIVNRQRTEDERRDAPGADVPQPDGACELASNHRRERQAFGGLASVA